MRKAPTIANHTCTLRVVNTPPPPATSNTNARTYKHSKHARTHTHTHTHTHINSRMRTLRARKASRACPEHVHANAWGRAGDLGLPGGPARAASYGKCSSNAALKARGPTCHFPHTLLHVPAKARAVGLCVPSFYCPPAMDRPRESVADGRPPPP